MYTELVEDVYEIPLHGPREQARAHLLDWASPTLVDAGAAPTADRLVSALEKIGIRPEHLVITHGDFDHIDGFDVVVDRFDPETWVPAETTCETDETPDHRFEHGETVGPFEAVHVPGHTDDNYAFVNESRGVAALGDVLIGADRRGLPAGYFLLPEAIYSLDLIAAERYLDRLLEYDFEVGLVTHGSSVLEDASEKIENYVNFPDRPSWSEARRPSSEGLF